MSAKQPLFPIRKNLPFGQSALGGSAHFVRSKKVFWGGGIIALVIVILLGQQRGIAITNAPSKEVVSGVTKKASELTSGFIPNGDLSLDPAKELFVDKKSPDARAGKEVIQYTNQANDAIPLTSEALRFALEEAILGEYNPLKDAVSRLKEGELALQGMQAPLDAITFHKMSIALLREYQRILSVPLNVPREQFDPNKLKSDFARLDVLVSLAKQESQTMVKGYAVPLFPKVIIFYEEIIGKR